MRFGPRSRCGGVLHWRTSSMNRLERVRRSGWKSADSYRSGRQAEALAALQAARHRLAEELGLEPGPQLRELERQILQHDPALSVSSARRSRAMRRRWPVAVGLGATAIAAAAVLGVVLGIGQTTASRTLAQNGDTLVSVDVHSGRIG